MKHRFTNPDHPNWPLWSHGLNEALGIKGKLPPEGLLPPKEVQGIMVYVNPLVGEKPAHGKRHTHRVMAICPDCGKHMSAGRLHQHVCKKVK